MKPNLHDELIQTAITASLAAGDAIMRIYDTHEFEVTNKSDDTPLTKADRAGHFEIMNILSKTGLPVLSEEGKNIPYEERKDWHLFWMVDPLDGTKEFIKRNGEFTVNIALIEHGKPIAGVVYVPVKKELYWAMQGKGAWKRSLGDATETQLENKDFPTVSSIVASRSHMSAETAEFIRNYPGASIISMGSSLKFLLVAEGKAQIYPRFAPTMEWDTAAAQAIVENSGCEVLTYPSLKPVSYNKSDLLNEWFICKRKDIKIIRSGLKSPPVL